MIPKRIYQIWIKKDINAPIPQQTQKFIYNVKQWCLNNDYEHILIDDNSPLLKECMKNSNFCRKQIELNREKKIVSIADYLRLYVLNKYGGIYLDCDVKIYEGFDEFLNNSLFIGQEKPKGFNDFKEEDLYNLGTFCRRFRRFDVGTIGCKGDSPLLQCIMYLMDAYLYKDYLEGSIHQALKTSPYKYNTNIDMWLAIPDLFPFVIEELGKKKIVPIHALKTISETDSTFEVFDETYFSENGRYADHCFHTMWGDK